MLKLLPIRVPSTRAQQSLNSVHTSSGPLPL